MIISAINRFSLIDFPWEVCAIIFTPWCNFRCGFCHNSEFVLPEKIEKIKSSFIPLNIVLNFLETRKGKLTWVSICGGEPTIQKDLFHFCYKIKEMWFKIKLDTNWRDPKIIKELIDKKLVDYVAMDIKNEIWKFSESAWIKLDESPYLETIKILLNSNIDYEFRTTVIKWVHDEKIIENIAKYIGTPWGDISWAKSYYIQNYKWWNTLDPNFKWESFFEKELEEFKRIGEKYIKNVWIRN